MTAQDLNEYLEYLFQEEDESTNISQAVTAWASEEIMFLECKLKEKWTRKLDVINKIDHLFSIVMDSLVKKKPIEISVVDISKSVYFDYDQGYFTLLATPKLINYNLNSSSSAIAQIMYLCNYFHSKILNGQISSKREIYYSNVDLLKNMITLNKRIVDICYMLDINRFDLELFPSEKGLFSGDIAIRTSSGNYKHERSGFGDKNLITHCLIYDEFTIESSAMFILVVEKDTVNSFL